MNEVAPTELGVHGPAGAVERYRFDFRQSFRDMKTILRPVDQRPDVFADATGCAVIDYAVRKGVSIASFGHIGGREVAVADAEVRKPP